MSSLEVGLLNVQPQILRAVFLVPQLRTFHRVDKNNNASVGLLLSHESRRHLPQALQSPRDPLW